MKYDSVATSIDKNANDAEGTINEIKSISFDSIWSGESYQSLTTSLKKKVDELDIKIQNIKQYAVVLSKLQEYKSCQEELASLQAALASLPDEEEYDGQRASLEQQIKVLQEKINTLRTFITQILSSILSDTKYEYIHYADFVIDIKNSEYYTEEEFERKKNVKSKWETNFLDAALGTLKYVGEDGRVTKETWCDLDPTNLARLMRKQGIDLDFWIREDGVYMYGDYVMVAADIPHMDGTEQAAEYRKGDLVETSLGTGMVVDLCGMAEMVRKGELKGTAHGDVEVWYDIYTAWHEPGQYHHVGYCKDPNCTDSYHTAGKTMLYPSGTKI